MSPPCFVDLTQPIATLRFLGMPLLPNISGLAMGSRRGAGIAVSALRPASPISAPGETNSLDAPMTRTEAIIPLRFDEGRH